MSAAATAGAATLPPTLAGEAFDASMSVDDPTGAQFPFILGQCGNWDYAGNKFDISGQATGPYPGSFEEQGSITYSSDEPGPNGFGQGPVLTFASTFTITAQDGVTISAVGTTTLVPNGDLAVCWESAGGGGVNIGPFLTHYTATITKPDGTSFQDSGSSYLTLSQDVGEGQYWDASLIQSFFATPPPPPPTPPPSPTPQPAPTPSSTPSAPTSPPSSRGGSTLPTSSKPVAPIKLLLPSKLGIAGLLRQGGYTWALRAPQGGRLVVAWYRAGQLVALGHAHFTKSGSVSVRIRLTASGRRLLQAHQSLRVTAKATYTPTAGSAVSVTRVLRLVK